MPRFPTLENEQVPVRSTSHRFIYRFTINPLALKKDLLAAVAALRHAPLHCFLIMGRLPESALLHTPAFGNALISRFRHVFCTSLCATTFSFSPPLRDTILSWNKVSYSLVP